MNLKITVLGLCFLTTSAQWANAQGKPAVTAAQQNLPAVRVDGGQLQGVADNGVVSYKGIPFAAPPVGDLRWRPPQPAAPWTGVRQAKNLGRIACRDGSARHRPLVPLSERRQKIVCS